MKWLAQSVVCAMLLSASDNGWAQNLTGTDRSSFIDGAINTCMSPKNTEPLTKEIPMPLFAEYCRCYATGLADRASMSDLKEDNPDVMIPIVRDVSKACYEAMKRSGYGK